MKSPDRFDFAKTFLYIGSMHGDVPMMLAIVGLREVGHVYELLVGDGGQRGGLLVLGDARRPSRSAAAGG